MEYGAKIQIFCNKQKYFSEFMDLTQKILTKEEINSRFLDAVQALLTNGIVSSKTTLAEAFGVKPAKFSEILNGRMKAGADMLAIICDYYFVSPDWLLMSRGDNIFRNSETLPPVIIYEGGGCTPAYLKETHENDTSANIQQKITEPFIALIGEKDKIIMQQAEEIGRLKERIAQLEREKGKDVSDVRTSGVANAG